MVFEEKYIEKYDTKINLIYSDCQLDTPPISQNITL